METLTNFTTREGAIPANLPRGGGSRDPCRTEAAPSKRWTAPEFHGYDASKESNTRAAPTASGWGCRVSLVVVHNHARCRGTGFEFA
jgi:hypothetical protein